MAERTCSSQENDANADKCMRDRPGVVYRRVWAKVSDVDQAKGTVVYRAKNVAGDIEKFTVVWASNDVWVPCPSSLDSPAGGYPSVGAEGFLYLEDGYLRRNNIKFVETPKWPDRASGEGLTHELPVWPVRLVGTFVELVDGFLTEKEIDLLDYDLADSEQTIVLRPGASSSIKLTRKGFAKFLLPFPTLRALKDAVATIKNPVDAQQVADAWQQVAAWKSALEKHQVTAVAEREDAQKLVRQVLPR
jgi:hypothetical protein